MNIKRITYMFESQIINCSPSHKISMSKHNKSYEK